MTKIFLPYITAIAFSFILLGCSKEESFEVFNELNNPPSGNPNNPGSGGGGGNNNTLGDNKGPVAESLFGTWVVKSIKFNSETDLKNDPNSLEGTVRLTVAYEGKQPLEGKIIINSKDLTNDMGRYECVGTQRMAMYFNGKWEDIQADPFNQITPPIKITTLYKLVGTDSIYTQGGSELELPNNSTTLRPSGYRFKIEGKKLTLIYQATINETVTMGSIKSTQIIKVKNEMVYEKQ